MKILDRLRYLLNRCSYEGWLEDKEYRCVYLREHHEKHSVHLNGRLLSLSRWPSERKEDAT